jgi:putative aldouronate transport system permease protein
MIFGNFKASSPATGETTAFYKIFNIGIGVLISSVFIILSGYLDIVAQKIHIRFVKKYFFLYSFMIIPLVYIFVLFLYPIMLQTIISFKDYKLSTGIWSSDWIGFDNFKKIFLDPSMGYVILNTIYVSFLRLITGLLPPIILAIILFDLKSQKFRKSIQTIIYIPHFFSWVVIYAIVFAFLTPSGIVNTILVETFGKEPIDFLARGNLFIPIQLITSIWKEMGWGTILYLAALSNVDQNLYEAASIDGAGPFKRHFHITIPGIAPVIVFLTIMSVGSILKGAGGEQMLIFTNNAVIDKAQVIDTWVYWQGIGKLQYGLGAAVSFFQSGVGLVMVLLCNKLSKKATGIGLW